MDRTGMIATDLVLNALKKAGIRVVKVSDEQAEKFLSVDDYAARAQMSMGKPWYQSNAVLALDRIQQDKATATQWLAMLTKVGGIKVAEDKWTGLSAWLQSQGNEPLTRQQVTEYVASNSLDLREEQFIDFETAETRLTEDLQREFDELVGMGAEITGSLYKEDHWEYAYEEMCRIHGNDFRQGFLNQDGLLYINEAEQAAKVLGLNSAHENRMDYTTYGLTEKKEIALYIPDVEPWNEHDKIHFGEVGEGRCIAWIRFGTDRVIKNYSPQERKAYIEAMPNAGRWLKHETSGKYSTEVWNPPVPSARYPEAHIWKHADRYRIMGVNDMLCTTHLTLEDAVDAYNRHIAPKQQETKVLVIDEIQSKRIQQARHDTNVPLTPFQGNWHELCMKRMLHYAAENGFDKVVWTTGEMQNQRYDMSARLLKVKMKREAEGDRVVNLKTNYGDYCLSVKPDGSFYQTVHVFGVRTENLAGLVGKTLAERIMQMEDNGRLEGDGLEIGGEGMKNFYDRMLPQFMDRYGKKWNVRTGNLTLNLEGEDMTFHGVDVTPEMKKSVLQGQPLFMKDTKGRVYGWAMDDTIYLTHKGLNAETAIHEYTHLWANAMRLTDRKAWNHIKDLLRGTEVWNEVRKDPDYRHLRGNEDALANEVLARVSGRDNTQKLEQAIRQATSRDSSVHGLQRVRQAIGQFWSWVGRHVLDIRQARSLSDVTDRVLGDLLRGTPLNRQTVTTPEAIDTESLGRTGFKR